MTKIKLIAFLLIVTALFYFLGSVADIFVVLAQITLVGAVLVVIWALFVLFFGGQSNE